MLHLIETLEPRRLLASTSSISGVVFNDTNADGVKQAAEAPLASRKFFIDADRDGVLDAGEKTAVSNSAGLYTFGSLAAGTYRVREVPLSGWRHTTPSSGYYTITLAAGQTVTGKNFGYTRNVLITGSVFNDFSGDGIRNFGETGLGGWRIFIDRNNNGLFDAGENSVLSDRAGNWQFRQLPAGTYTVRIVHQPGWTRTTPATGTFKLTLGAGGVSTTHLFGFRQA